MDPALDAEGTNTAIPETTAVFIIASYQYVACGAIFSVGVPWKQWPTRNRAFCVWLLVVALSAIGVTLLPSADIATLLSLQQPPPAFRWALWGLGIVAFLSYFVAIGAVFAARSSGLLSLIEFRGPPKIHKALRKEWRDSLGARVVINKI